MTVREREGDRRNEKALAERIERAYGMRLYLSHTLCPYDAVGLDRAGKFSLWELKPRPYPITKHDEMMIDVAKISTVRREAFYLGIPAFVVWGFTDGEARCVPLDRRPDRVEINGRRDRNDPRDWEPVAFFSVDRMEVIP